MKYLVLALVIMVSAAASLAVPEISGVFRIGGATLFVLVEDETGTSSGWIEVGDEFGGYVLTRFDAEREVLVLAREGKEFEAGLRAAAIKDMRIALSGTIRLGVDEDAEAQKVVLVFDQESRFPWGPGTTLFVMPKRRADGNIEYRARWEMITGDGAKDTLSAPKVITRPDGAFGVRVGDFGFELKP